MRGPCVLCGATDYALSYGGTDICPACDCGNTAGRIRQQVWEIGDLRRRLAQAREENARLREVVDLCAIWFEADDEERKSMGGDDRMREALAACGPGQEREQARKEEGR